MGVAGGDIPTDIYGESLTGRHFETLTVKPRKKKEEQQTPGQMSLDDFGAGNATVTFDTSSGNQQPINTPASESKNSSPESSVTSHEDSAVVEPAITPTSNMTGTPTPMEVPNDTSVTGNSESATNNVDISENLFDREAVMKFINDAGLLSYDVRAIRISNYLVSLFKMAHLLTMSGLHRESIREIQSEIVQMIHDHVELLKSEGRYDEFVLQVKQFKLATQIFDAFGETVDNYSVHDLFTTTDSDVDRQFRVADSKLCNEGIGNVYGNKYMDVNNLSAFKVDVILFVADDECMNNLYQYAETRFHGLNDEYRRYIATVDSEKVRKQYDSIVSDGDIVSKHNFRLPETIQVPHEDGGREYANHLFVNNDSGVAKLKLNTWETGVIAEEEKRDDFVCWIRNPSRGAWALCIPYEVDTITKPTYPDFIVIRKDKISEYVIDILEPHNPEFKDNLGKAKGFAEYARQNPGVGRIQLIRMSKDAAGKNRFKRLDMSKSAIRDKVSHVMSNDELDHIFDTDGFFM